MGGRRTWLLVFEFMGVGDEGEGQSRGARQGAEGRHVREHSPRGALPCPYCCLHSPPLTRHACCTPVAAIGQVAHLILPSFPPRATPSVYLPSTPPPPPPPNPTHSPTHPMHTHTHTPPHTNPNTTHHKPIHPLSLNLTCIARRHSSGATSSTVTVFTTNRPNVFLVWGWEGK